MVLFIIFGCTKVDENGFYVEGKYKNLHKITKKKFDEEGYDIEGFNKNGFNRQFINKLTNTKFDKNGYNHLGFDKNGYDKYGYDDYGYDKNGFNREGYDKNGFDKDGYNKRGFNRNKIHKVTKTKYDENDYDYYGKKFESAFEKKYFVDDFGDPTDQKYILQTIDGSFSNSATDNSPAYIKLIYSGGNKLRFDMHEYNPGSKAHYSSYERYKIRLKSDSGKTLDDELSIETSLKGCLMLYNSKAVEMVKKSNNIKVYIYEVDDDYPWQQLDTKYSFTIDCTGFIDGISYLK